MYFSRNLIFILWLETCDKVTKMSTNANIDVFSGELKSIMIIFYQYTVVCFKVTCVKMTRFPKFREFGRIIVKILSF